MNAETGVRRAGRRARAFGSVVIFGAALALLGYDVVTAAKHPGAMPAAAAAAGVMVTGNAAPEATSMAAKETDRVGASGDSYTEPRECDAGKGITTACVYED